MSDTFEFELGEEVEICLTGTVEKRQDGITGGNRYLVKYGPGEARFWFYEDQIDHNDNGPHGAEVIPLRAA